MKYALLTIASGDYFQQMGRLTHPTLKAYADKIGADFIVWSDVSGYTVAQYKKMEIGGLFDTYDRVVYIDTDIIIRDDAPNILDVVPTDEVGLFEEGKYFDRRQSTLQFMAHIGYNGAEWDGNYYNTGVLVSARCHRHLYAKPPVQWNHFGEQTWFNVVLCGNKAKVFQLPYRLNRMVTLNSFYGEDRLDAWFLHYAGVHSFCGPENALKLIAHDLHQWQQNRPAYRYRSHVALVIEGGLGEQIAAEPAVRYARDVLYQNEDLVIVSKRGEVFRHLELPIVEEFRQIPAWDRYHKREMSGCGELSRHQVHPTSLASLALLGVELPTAQKSPRLPADPLALASVSDKVRPSEIGSLVLLHPGRGAAADTFPPDVWQSYADVLVDGGFRVAVIGRREGEEGIVEFDRARSLDLVDKLSVEELIALVSRARVLVSNDSWPVQMAGAGECWIGLIAGLRHPDYVLPWRRGSQSFRAKNLARGELYRDYLHRPSGGVKPDLGAYNPQRLRGCLPEPSTILEFVKAAFAEA
jgi:Glycosyl transferase family 8/Glycosyltransferase family 9 (heptosyltransferase)